MNPTQQCTLFYTPLPCGGDGNSYYAYYLIGENDYHKTAVAQLEIVPSVIKYKVEKDDVILEYAKMAIQEEYGYGTLDFSDCKR